MTPEDFRERVAGVARAVYSCGLIGVGAESDATTFLDALAAEGVITVIRK